MAKIGINMVTASLQAPEQIVGVDMGVTHSAIAMVRGEDSTAILLKDIDGLALVPNDMPLQPQALTHEALTTLLTFLKKRAEHILKTAVQKIVLTIPTQFGELQKQMVLAAAAEIDLQIVRMLDRPVAAAIAYGFDKVADDAQGDIQQKIFVIELDSNGINVNIVDRYNAILDVTGRGSATFADDISALLVRYWKGNFGVEDDDELTLAAENAIEYLNGNERYDGVVAGKPIFITRPTLNEVLAPVASEILGAINELLQRKRLEPANVDAVIMTGSHAAIPYLNEQVRNLFGKALHDDIDPQQVAVLGAAIQANSLA